MEDSSNLTEKSSSMMPEHEVFLSFRGEDTRSSFTAHLHASLQNEGITVFIDEDSLQRGDLISTSIHQAIQKSQICIIVFSTNYADSRWCLAELVTIMECRTTTGLVVLPVFYDVDPSEVRHQTGEFGRAFQTLLTRLSNKEGIYDRLGNSVRYALNSLSIYKDELPNQGLVWSWRAALREASGLAGFVVLNSRNENEAIKAIVEKVTQLLDKTDLFVANNPVGVETRVQDMLQLLDIRQSNDVHLVGMWGMGGIGKTTIAKAIYNKIGRNFEARSFLANTREVWEKNDGPVSLQQQLLFDICKESKTKIRSIAAGKIILKDILCGKRVFLVLDDVSTLDQLNALCGSRQWFGSGSRIIITTRDMHILRVNRVDQVYTMKEMDESESIELFSWNAFKQATPREEFVGISQNVVEYSGKLPLALEVLGSYLCDRGITEWKCVLDKLKRIPIVQVQNKLKISYDGLNDDFEKEIFLDIACFFIGMDQNDVIHILNGCELYAEIGINVLLERNLVTIDDRNRLGMHALLRDMGREIIREESPKILEQRSRLWFSNDALNVLFEQTGTKVVEGLTLMLPRDDAKCFSTKAFEKMTRLRLLQLGRVQLDGDFEYLSRNLRWLSWNGFPLTCIPSSFYQGNLVSIELENSNIKLLWKETQRLEKLKILNLSHSHYLTETPNFSYLPNLEQLILSDCPMLYEVSPTIEHLNKILLINLEDCINLCSLPRSIYKLKSLKTLILSGCLKIEKLEEDFEEMESLTTLIANNTAITKMSFSIRLEKLKILKLSHSPYLTQTPNFSNLPNLEQLTLSNCRMLSEISPSIGHLNKILLINLEGCISLCSLPRSFYKLKSLETLILSGCLKIEKLEEDLEQMESLTTLIANNTAIRKVPFSIVRSKSIVYISLCGYEGFPCDVFPSIIWSWMSPRNDPLLQFNIMSSLVPLDVPLSNSHELISKVLPSLQSIWLQCSSELQLSCDAAIILEALYATNYNELESAATTSLVSQNSLKPIFIRLGMNCQVANILKEKIAQNMAVHGCGGFLLPSDIYPYCLTFNCEGASVIFEVPEMEGCNLKTILCVVYSSNPENIASNGLKNVMVKNYTKATIQLYKREVSFEDEEDQRLVSSIEPGNKMEVVVVLENNLIVKKTTIYLIYDEPIGKIMEQSHAPDQARSKGKASKVFALGLTFLGYIKWPLNKLIAYMAPKA